MSHLRLLAAVQPAGALDFLNTTVSALMHSVPAQWPAQASVPRSLPPPDDQSGMSSLPHMPMAVPRSLARQFIAVFKRELAAMSGSPDGELARVRPAHRTVRITPPCLHYQQLTQLRIVWGCRRRH